MAPPTVRSSGIALGNSVTLPSTTAVGDVILLAQSIGSSGTANPAALPSGTGWTTLNFLSTTRMYTRYWWKYATVAGSQAYTATPQTGASGGYTTPVILNYVVVAGADAGDPIDGTSFTVGVTSGTTTITRPAEDLLIGFFAAAAAQGSTTVLTTPTGMTRIGGQDGSFVSSLITSANSLSGTSAGPYTTGNNGTGGVTSGQIVITNTRLLLKSGSVTTTLGVSGTQGGVKRSTGSSTSTLGAQPSTTARKAVSRTQATTLALTTSATPVPHHYGTVASALALGWSTKRIFGTVQSLGLTSTVTGGRSARATAVSTLGLTSPATGLHRGQGAITSALGLFWDVPVHRKAGTGLTSSTLALTSRIDAYITGGEPPPDPSQEIQTRAYVPSQNAPVRFIVQDILTGEIRDWDFPLSEVEITFNLSGATSLRATLGPEYRELGETHLDAWASWIHVEEAGAIRASVIVQPMAVSDQNMDIEGIGFTGYPNGIPYQGELSLIEVDPIQVVRLIWVHLLSFPDAAIGITMDATASPITLGTPAVTVPVLKDDGTPAYDITTETDADGNVTETGRTAKTQDIEAKPYELNWYDDKDCGQEIDSLAKSTPFDFAERVTWNAARTAVLHHLMVGYPRLGTRRFDLRFAEDENLLQVVTALETPDHYASQVIVRGSGEGRDAIRGYAGSRDPRRLRRIATVVDKTLTDATVAASMANEELRRRVSVTEFSDIVIDATHDNAPLGSWAIGDDILVQCNIPYIGEVALWHRIVAYVWTPDSDVVTLNLKRSEQFAYGELGGAIGGSRTEEPQADYVIGEDSTTNTTLPSTDDGTGTGTDDGSGDVTTTYQRKVGVGGIPTATAGSGVTILSANSSSVLHITTDGVTYDGNGKTVPGVVVEANDVTVQNFYVKGADGTGIYSFGDGNIIANCDITQVKVGDSSAPNENDINGVTFFGSTKILYNSIGVSAALVNGSPLGSHTDGIQTWNTSSKQSSSDVEIVGNVISGPAANDPAYIHQGVQAEGAPSTDGGGGGTGTSSNWTITDNTFKTYGNQALNFLGVSNVKIARNTFSGGATKVVGTGDGSTGITYYSDNKVTGTYSGGIGVSVTNSNGPTNPYATYTVTTPGTGGGSSTGTADTSTAAGKLGWGTAIFSDEFTTDGAPNSAQWSRYDGPGHDGNGRRVPGQIAVTGGKLVITGLANGDSGGMAHTLNQKYGRWEVRVRSQNTGTANGNLYSPVLIIWPKSDKWPDDGEYDFYEPGQAGGTTAGAYIHYPSTTVKQEHATKAGVDLTQFHNFAIDWQATGIKGYIDGVEWFNYSSGGIQNMPSGHLTIQLDNFDGTSQTPAVMEVEWVRIYSATSTGPTTGSGGTTGGTTGGGSTGGGNATYPMDLLDKRWYLTTPEPDGDGVESIYRPALDTLVRESNTKRTFKLNADKTGIIMTADYGGAHTPNSTNVRMEFREMELGSTGSGSKADWSTSSGTHTMEWVTSVDRLDGNHCVIGQIHDADDDTSVFRLEGGTLYMTNGDDTHANTVLTGYTLGTKLTLKLVASGGKIDGYVNGVKKATVSASKSGCYFKVGNYLQRKGASGSYTQTTLYSCTVTHS